MGRLTRCIQNPQLPAAGAGSSCRGGLSLSARLPWPECACFSLTRQALHPRCLAGCVIWRCSTCRQMRVGDHQDRLLARMLVVRLAGCEAAWDVALAWSADRCRKQLELEAVPVVDLPLGAAAAAVVYGRVSCRDRLPAADAPYCKRLPMSDPNPQSAQSAAAASSSSGWRQARPHKQRCHDDAAIW